MPTYEIKTPSLLTDSQLKRIKRVIVGDYEYESHFTFAKGAIKSLKNTISMFSKYPEQIGQQSEEYYIENYNKALEHLSMSGDLPGVRELKNEFSKLPKTLIGKTK